MGSHDILNMKQEIEYLSRLITVHKEREKLRTSVSKSCSSLFHPPARRTVHSKSLLALKRKFISSKVPTTSQPTIKFTSKHKVLPVNPYKLDRTHSQGISKTNTSSSAQLSKQRTPKLHVLTNTTKSSPTAGKVLSRNKYKLVKCHKETPLKNKLVNKSHVWKAASFIVKKYSTKFQQPCVPPRTGCLRPSSLKNSVNLRHKLVRSLQKRKLKCHLSSPASSWFQLKQYHKGANCWACPKGKMLSKTTLGYTINRNCLKHDRKINSKIVSIGGILYKASKNKLSRTGPSSVKNTQHNATTKGSQVLVIRGIRFQMDSNGRTLKRVLDAPPAWKKANQERRASIATRKRIDIGGNTYQETQPGVFVKTVNTRYFISHAVNRSIRTLRSEQRKLKKQYCMFYNRFGRCNKGTKCPYIHDPEKVAICTRFLRGTCKVDECPFSHKILPSKMPVCSFFLQGRCSNDHCPYQHVKVNSEAGICMNFVKGYCASGVTCTKMHMFVCPQFSRTGNCPKGRQCPLLHREKKCKRRSLLATKTDAKQSTDSFESSLPSPSNVSQETNNLSETCSAKKQEEPDIVETHPTSTSSLPKLPSYISLSNISPLEIPRQATVLERKGASSLRIRPLFLTKKSSS